MIETIIEVCKENPYRDLKTGRFTSAPGNRNKKVPDSDIDVILEVIPNRTRWMFKNLGLGDDITRLPTINLLPKEKKMVESELTTNLSKEDREKPFLIKTTGHYTYVFEKFGYNCYRFMVRRLAKRIVENAKEDK